jgi:hypothetical protein
VANRPYWNYDRHGREISTASDYGLPPNLVRDMHASTDGFDAQLEALKTSAARVLDSAPVDRNAFIAHFDTLSPPIQAKALQTLRAHPHLNLFDLIDKVQPTLTLTEMDEAMRWIGGLRK